MDRRRRGGGVRSPSVSRGRSHRRYDGDDADHRNGAGGDYSSYDRSSSVRGSGDGSRGRRERDDGINGGDSGSSGGGRRRHRHYDDKDREEEYRDRRNISSSSSHKRQRFTRDDDDDVDVGRDSSRSIRPANPFIARDIAPHTLTAEAAVVEEQEERVPLSIEELLEKKRLEEEQQSRPRFLSKSERRELAKEERSRAMQDRRQQIEQMRRQREQILLRHRGDGSAALDGSAHSVDPSIDIRDVLRMEEAQRREAEEIKRDLMSGVTGREIESKRKRGFRSGERNKFSFEWDPSEDTSQVHDTSALGRPVEAAILFGRGRRAGVDLQEQRAHSRFYDQLVQERTGRSEKHRDRGSRRVRRLLDLSEMGKHWSEKTLEEMEERDWRILREDFEIVTKGGKVANPIRSWSEANLPPVIMDAIRHVGYVKPTPIQMQCIPIGLQNKDLIGLAETGSGKTAAFVIPMLVYITSLPKLTPQLAQYGPYALVLVPTRELAHQIEDEARRFASFMGVRVASVVGGIDKDQQLVALRDGVEILIGTPGRLVDLLESRYIALSQCNYIVMDEADKMIDMGFEEEVNKILDAMPSSNTRPENEEEEDEQKRYRQTIMFSATMPPAVERLANEYLRRRVYVSIGEVGRAVDRIEQTVQFVKSEMVKQERLYEQLDMEDGPVIVFLNQQKAVDVLVRDLIRRGYQAVGLHGGKNQELREIAMEGFKTGKHKILVATDVVARGIDVKGVTLVINYDLPKTIQEYTHRIGRTGRAGSTGRAVSYLTNSDTHIMYDLRQMLLETKQPVPPELDQHEAARKPPEKRRPAKLE